jgi:hypothetical protein
MSERPTQAEIDEANASHAQDVVDTLQLMVDVCKRLSPNVCSPADNNGDYYTVTPQEIIEFASMLRAKDAQKIAELEAEVQKLREEIADANENFDAIRNILHDTQAMVAMQSEALKLTREELRACQAAIHLSGDFDPLYVSGAQAAMKIADKALSATAETVAAWEAKKLAEQQAIVANFFKLYGKDVSDCGLDELTKREAAAKQAGFEEGYASRKLCSVTVEESLIACEAAKQAGRDDVMKELSEMEPVAYRYEYTSDLNGDKQGNWPVELITHVRFSSTKPDCDVTMPLIVRPTYNKGI